MAPTRCWLPLIVYRGEHFKSDREGIRGLVFQKDRGQLDFSFNATQPRARKLRLLRRTGRML